MTPDWPSIAFWGFLAGSFACAVLGVWQWQKRGDERPEREAGLVALFASSLWCLLAAATGPDGTAAALGETLRNLAWLFFVYRLFASDGRDASVAPVRPVLAALAFVEMLHPALHVIAGQLPAGHGSLDMVFHLAVMFRLMLAVGALVLVHNLYAGALSASRNGLRWTGAALAAMWIYDLNFYTVAYLTDRQPEGLGALRGTVAALMAVLLAIAHARGADLRLRPSRAVAFQSLALLVIGLYLVVMVGAAQSLAWLGGDVAPLAQIGFVFTTTVLALVILPSSRLKGWLKAMATRHLFQHRYDYRAEWLRFTGTIGRGDSAAPLEERVIQALGDITDSASGLLLTPGEYGELTLAARWRWRTVEVPAEALGAGARRFFEADGFIVDLDRVRRGAANHGEAGIVSRWLLDDQAAWALVPLLHFERLVGVVVLARPAHPRQLDWEDFDLLRVVGRQLASYLAEHAGQSALLDASRFDEFNRRIAFVMHDIKNLASQLSLLGRNAERHGENPEFRADMLLTVRNSADKLNALLARLSRYSANPLDRLEEVDAAAVARAVVAAAARHHPVSLGESQPCRVIANRETLEQVLTHLVQNAVDASEPGSPVSVRVTGTGLHGAIEVIDSGAGMSADFVRNRLFKPFVSTKPGGFGIGAFEARELVRAMQGRLDVESREGLGSRFVVRLPLAAAAGMLESLRTRTGGATRDGSHEAKVA